MIIVGIMMTLAITGLVVGVANDAVNFLNSALGSKVAPRYVIMTVASVGIIVGAITSSGMMEVARSGVFHPEMFSFSEVMMLFLAVMFMNVILLDVFNTLGMPTSTTVSLVFGLLGATCTRWRTWPRISIRVRLWRSFRGYSFRWRSLLSAVLR